MKQKLAFSVVFAVATMAITVAAYSSPNDLGGCRLTYNSRMIGCGISAYFSHFGVVPGSLEELIRDGWVPDNLINPYNGLVIEGDAPPEEAGGFALNPIGPSEIELAYSDGNKSISVIYDDDVLGRNTVAVDLITARAGLMVNWAYACLEAYQMSKEDQPRSVAELRDADFWPYENAENIVFGGPMSFDSDAIGDMNWVFGAEHVDVQLRLPDDQDGGKRVVGLDYPPAIEI